MKKTKIRDLRPGDLIVVKDSNKKFIAMVKNVWPNGDGIDCWRSFGEHYPWEKLSETMYYLFNFPSYSKKVWILEATDCIMARAGVEKMKAKEEDKNGSN